MSDTQRANLYSVNCRERSSEALLRIAVEEWKANWKRRYTPAELELETAVCIADNASSLIRCILDSDYTSGRNW